MSMPNAESNISPVKASDNLLPVWLLNCNAVNKGFDRFIDKNNGLPPSDEWQVSSTIQISRIEELEDEYGRVSDPEIRNHISRTLMSLYHYGSFNGRSIKKDYKKGGCTR